MSIFPDETPPTTRELVEWRLWVGTVVLPNAQAMRDLIVNHTELLLGRRHAPIAVPAH